MISKSSKIGMISVMSSMLAHTGVMPVMSPGGNSQRVKSGSPGVAKRRAKRKAQKLARRANR